MERWLSTSRVLIGLSLVLLIAALNRQDDMLYRMFLFLATVSALGYALPWWSLRSLRVTPAARFDTTLMEGEPLVLHMLVHTASRWPAFMVDVVTEWHWAERTIETRHTLGMVRRGQAPQVLQHLQLPCRGAYAIQSVRLECGFPLGLMNARRELYNPGGRVLVLPRPTPVSWPIPWRLAPDHRGERTTRDSGPSFEPGILKPYEPGQAVGRVNWRASARAGALVIQQFQHVGLPRLHLVVARPGARDWGHPQSAGEAAIRLASGLVRCAVEQGVEVLAALPDAPSPARDEGALMRHLACVRAGDADLERQFSAVRALARAGDQMAVAVPASVPADALLRALATSGLPASAVQIWMASGPEATATERAQTGLLQRTLQQAGWAVHTAEHA
jgi:uncharacterized protein (DUF58 family)